MEDWPKLLSSPLPLFFVRFSYGLAFLCLASFFLSCSPCLPQCLSGILVVLILFSGFLPFSSVQVSSVPLCFFVPVLFYVGLSLLPVAGVLKEILQFLSSVSLCLCFFFLWFVLPVFAPSSPSLSTGFSLSSPPLVFLFLRSFPSCICSFIPFSLYRFFFLSSPLPPHSWPFSGFYKARECQAFVHREGEGQQLGDVVHN